MSSSARTVFFFGIYLALTGLTLLFAPNVLLGMFDLPETSEVWIRVVGMLAGYIGFYYIQAARQELTTFFRLTVYTRSTAILFFAAFVWLGYAELPLVLFGVVDFLGAMWTWWALRAEGRAG